MTAPVSTAAWVDCAGCGLPVDPASARRDAGEFGDPARRFCSVACEEDAAERAGAGA